MGYLVNFIDLVYTFEQSYFLKHLFFPMRTFQDRRVEKLLAPGPTKLLSASARQNSGSACASTAAARTGEKGLVGGRKRKKRKRAKEHARWRRRDRDR